MVVFRHTVNVARPRGAKKSTAGEPGRWVPLLLFVLVVVLEFDYHAFFFR